MPEPQKDEQLKIARLAERVTRLEEENEALREKIDRIKNHPLWKMSAPLRSLLRNVSFHVQRVKRQGSVAGVVRKLKNKKLERERMADYGTKSFPTEKEREARMREIASWEKKGPAEGSRSGENADCATESGAGSTPLPLFSILVPLYNTPETFLREMIGSVLAQTYENWQLCLADGSDEKHAYVERVVREYAARDTERKRGVQSKTGGNLSTGGERNACAQTGSRIAYTRLAENRGISANTNACLALAEGDYIGLLDHDDILHPDALYLYAKEILEHGADYLYSDETTFSGDSVNHMLTMHFKPDYAIDNLRANNYICHFSVFARSLLTADAMARGAGEEEAVFRSEFDGSQDHDMILRLTDCAKNIVHVPRILYYWRSHAGSTAAGIEAKTYAIDAAKGAVSAHLKRHGFRNFRITSTRAFETIFKISYEIKGNPEISIVIPSRDHADDLKRCIGSIVEKSTWDNYEIIVVENGSTEKETFAYYDTAPCRVVTAPVTEFNFSDIVNHGVAQSTGDYVLLLNNDTEVIGANWMEELLMYAQREDVGAAGAKLYFPDKTIQHAGVVLALGAHRTAGHSHYGESRENLGYMGRLCYAQNMSAVTGACLMVAREKFDAVNGFDPSFAVSLNDVDFCLRLRKKGYLNVFTPFATLYHHESKSRGSDSDGARAARYEKESELFRERWKDVLAQGDPYYNPNFSLDHADFRLKQSEK